MSFWTFLGIIVAESALLLLWNRLAFPDVNQARKEEARQKKLNRFNKKEG